MGRLYCRQATATRLGLARLTATCGNTEANFALFLLMLVRVTPGTAPGSGGVWAMAKPRPRTAPHAASNVMRIFGMSLPNVICISASCHIGGGRKGPPKVLAIEKTIVRWYTKPANLGVTDALYPF